MKRFRCGDLVPGCQQTFEAETVPDLVGQVLQHARRDHGSQEVVRRFVAYLDQLRSDEPPERRGSAGDVPDEVTEARRAAEQDR